METITSAMMELDKLPDPFSLSFHSLSEETSTINHRAYTATTLSNSSNTTTTTSQNLCKTDSVEPMREMIFRMAALQPVHDIDVESVKPPKRRNVKISKDPQSVAARHRRERISERIRILQTLVPGGTKMDTASMLDEAVHYMKFLKKQLQSMEQFGGKGLASQFGY